MNYEDIFEETLIDLLKKKFHIADTNRLLIYLITRFNCIDGSCKKLDVKKFMSFVFDELSVSNHGEYGLVVHHDGKDCAFVYGYSTENSLSNVFDSIMFNIDTKEVSDENGVPMKVDQYIKNTYTTVIRDAKKKMAPYKTSSYYKELFVLFKLRTLNKYFNISDVIDTPETTFFYQGSELRSKEVLYERYLHAENFDTTNVKSVTEAQVRDYLYVNLDLIEDGLKPIAKEYPTNEGRVDILARDSAGNVVVIELKNENDKRLVWQCMYYPDEVRNSFPGGCKVRMITVAPDYPDFLLKPIQSLGYVECYTYTIHAFNKKIENMEVIKVDADGGLKVKKERRQKIDEIINDFEYTRNRLNNIVGDDVDDETLSEIALGLLKISCGNNSSCDNN